MTSGNFLGATRCQNPYSTQQSTHHTPLILFVPYLVPDSSIPIDLSFAAISLQYDNRTGPLDANHHLAKRPTTPSRRRRRRRETGMRARYFQTTSVLGGEFVADDGHGRTEVTRDGTGVPSGRRYDRVEVQMLTNMSIVFDSAASKEGRSVERSRGDNDEFARVNAKTSLVVVGPVLHSRGDARSILILKKYLFHDYAGEYFRTTRGDGVG
mmetsp:Transcript_33647/g.41214  ORF Transcript_33647/g.41214 Transcript_33647/m.41214 type:complete len:211 (-) Transcript_33647:269-901(-)